MINLASFYVLYAAKAIYIPRPRGTSILRCRGGGKGDLDHTQVLEAKFGARSGHVHQIRGKHGKFCHHKTQKLGKNANVWVISEIQRAKFGVFVTYIYGGKI